MSRFSPFVSRPEDFNCCFWDILLLLAGEPAFEFLREALSAPPGAPDEASSVDSPHRADVSVAEASEGGLEEAAPPGKARKAEDLPHAEETRGLLDDGKSRKRVRFSLGMRRKRRVPRERDRFPSFFLKLRACVLRANYFPKGGCWFFFPGACAKRFTFFFPLLRLRTEAWRKTHVAFQRWLRFLTAPQDRGRSLLV